MPGSYYRNPKSSCIAFTSFSATAETVISGKRTIKPGSKGIVIITFRRNSATYVLSTPLRYDFWKRFVNANSKGRFWNFNMKGKY